MRLISIIFSLLLLLALPAAAQERPLQLSCASTKGLVIVLDKLTDMMQLLNNSVGQTVSQSDLRKGSCGFKQFPPGSTAEMVGYFEDPSSKLIYMVFKVSYYPVNIVTGQRSNWADETYSVDAVVPASRWSIQHGRKCGFGYTRDCLVPKDCEALEHFQIYGNLLGFTPPGQLPDYVRPLRGQCQRYIIK